jgi:glutamate synthase domain-containing protein 3
MSKFAGSALALLVAFSIVPLTQSEAGDRSQRHRIMKHASFKMVDRSGHRHRRNVVRIVNRNVVVVKVAAKSRHRHDRPGNTYSGDVVIDVRGGAGQWSYGSYSSDGSSISVTTGPKMKIIDVGTLKADGACEMQAGVCVIRP